MKNSLGKFEGRVVEAAVLKLSGTIDDRVGTLHQDEEIYFVGKATVTKVTHGWVKEIYSRLHAGKASQLVIIDADGVITDARVALGAVGPTVIVADEAAASLIGTRADDAALAALDAAARAVCRPISDKRGTAEFRTKIAGVLARRVATIAYGRAKERT